MNTKKCPNCGFENKNTNINCENCDYKLIEETELECQEQKEDKPKENTKETLIEDEKSQSFAEILGGIITSIGGGLFAYFTSKIVINGVDTYTRIIGLPFFAAGLGILINGIAQLIKGIKRKQQIKNYINNSFDIEELKETSTKLDNLKNLGFKIYKYAFLIYWFGFLIVFTFFSLKASFKEAIVNIIFSIPFWIAGIYTAKNFDSK